MCDYGNGQWIVYGVVSWGPYMCGDKLSVFSDVAANSKWIVDILNAASENQKPNPIEDITLLNLLFMQFQKRNINVWRPKRASC